MYELVTSTGYRVNTATVEAMASALTTQLQRHRDAQPFTWTVSTPHGTVLTDTRTPQQSGTALQAGAAAAVEHAYGLLVRDNLMHAGSRSDTGLLHTTRSRKG